MRTFLASALFARPDVLLLDEPTNHLSIAAVLWLARELTTSEVGRIKSSYASLTAMTRPCASVPRRHRGIALVGMFSTNAPSRATCMCQTHADARRLRDLEG